MNLRMLSERPLPHPSLLRFFRGGFPLQPVVCSTLTESSTQQNVALVTGGSAGLGLVIAEKLMQAGYQVVILGRCEDKLKAAEKQLRSIASHVAAIRCDALDPSDLQSLAARIEKEFGRLDVLVNNIGQSDRGLTSELSADELRSIFDRNVITTLQCCQAMLPLLESSRGSVVNIGSLAGKVGARYLGAYVAAKHALSGLTQQMRLEWRDKGIHVAIVSPGPIRRPDEGTRYADHADGSLPEHATRPGGGTRVKGLTPERVAKAVLDCARRKRTDVILPGYLRLLITLGNAAPRLGDWLLLKFTSKSS